MQYITLIKVLRKNAFWNFTKGTNHSNFQDILNVKLSQLPRYKDALNVQMDKLVQCEQACSSETQRIEQSIKTAQDTFGSYTAYSDCMNPCLAQRVRLPDSSESSEE
ncbi:hypothetical protein T4D_14547 [Trichinella pseudospiralis]|uniref:Uncharacterized protein n=1 Tax=Trichinella pseudospiralis TaxID=6337 RepID=A0A0V1FGB0_TRIPS|nr:hypothetical protein T4D_14547 [Trichinella pseudospiralis]